MIPFFFLKKNNRDVDFLLSSENGRIMFCLENISFVVKDELTRDIWMTAIQNQIIEKK